MYAAPKEGHLGSGESAAFNGCFFTIKMSIPWFKYIYTSWASRIVV